ncbi:hypothetical protein H0H93_010960 [Arthromyces matolae]|nr:hypothetical protein H0H93_010960 [Arthromyces matolae]
MFRTGSPYSPFFTSGLLYNPNVDHHPQLRPRRSRDSLPSPKPCPSTTLPDTPLPKRNSTSTTIRKANRSYALARLEGRTNSTRRKVPKRNFMTMGDESDADDDDFFNLRPSKRVTSSLDIINEPEDLVLPPPSIPLTAPVGGRFPSIHPSPSHSKKPNDQWFHLKSFIDLHGGDDDSTMRWSWRSFVEVARVSTRSEPILPLPSQTPTTLGMFSITHAFFDSTES